MLQKIKLLIVAGLVVSAGVVALSSAVGTDTATALDPTKAASDGFKAAGGGDKDKTSLGATIKLVINILLFIAGTVAVIMIIFGGIRYVISNGDSSQITAAKNTILYAVIGLIVALLSYAIAGFVVDQFTK